MPTETAQRLSIIPVDTTASKIPEATKKFAANYAMAYILEKYDIAQNQLSREMNCARSTVNQWFNGVSEMLSNWVVEIGNALTRLESEEVADEFWQIYRTYKF